MSSRHALTLLVVLLAACGARSGLGVDGEEQTGGLGGLGATGAGAAGAGPSAGGGNGGADGGRAAGGAGGADVTTTTVSTTTTVTNAVSSSTGMPRCFEDIDCDDGVDCTVDDCTPDGCVYQADAAACDDGVFCTSDSCDFSLGCVNAHADSQCDDGVDCTLDACDALTDGCLNDPCDGLCDDGVFCNGVERCDSSFGCDNGPASCLGLACAQSSCSEISDRCDHVFTPGCVPPDVHLLLTDVQGRLYDAAPYQSPATTLLAPTNGSTHLDIAVLGQRWFVVDGALIELQPFTNQPIATLGLLNVNSLGAGPDGKLYGANQLVYRIDPDTFVIETLGPLPEGHTSSGDIAFLGDRLFVSTDSPCGGALVEFDVDLGTGTVLGGDGLGCVYGLAAVSGDLYIVNCDGTIGTFDPDTGIARILVTTTVQVYGADALL